MKRTLSEARAVLEDKIVPPPIERELAEREAEAKARGEAYVAGRLAEARAVEREITEGLCHVRDALEELAKRGQRGEVSSADYHAEMTRLMRRKEQLEERLARVEQAADRLEEVDSDPAAWTDELYRKYPTTRPHFSF